MDSLFLAKVIGIVIFAFGVAGLARPKNISDAVRDFSHESFARLVAGCSGIAIGAALVLTHNIWEWDYRGIITLFGWVVLVKGISYLVMPQKAVAFTKSMFMGKGQMKVWLIGSVIVGGYLAYKGFGF